MRRRLVFSAIAGLGVAFLASFIAFMGTRELLTKADGFHVYSAHDHLTEALSDYRTATGHFPESLADLKLRKSPEVDIDEQGYPLDPWGTPYIYERLENSYRLKSLGSDGKPGGWGTQADLEFPPGPHSRVQFEMSYWEFMIDEPTLATAATSALAGFCTFLIGACSAIRQKHDDESMGVFVMGILGVSFFSIIVGGILATWHVPIGEHH